MKRKISLAPLLTHLVKSLTLSIFLGFGTIFSRKKQSRPHPHKTLSRTYPCFFLHHPSFFILHLFTSSALSFEFQTGRISEGGFHNALSPLRQTAGQQGCNEILKGPFPSLSVCLSFCLSPFISRRKDFRMESLNKQIKAYSTEKKIKAYSFPLCMGFIDFIAYFSHSEWDYLPFQTWHHFHLRMGKNYCTKYCRGTKNAFIPQWLKQWRRFPMYEIHVTHSDQSFLCLYYIFQSTQPTQ